MCLTNDLELRAAPLANGLFLWVRENKLGCFEINKMRIVVLAVRVGCH